MTKKLVLKFSFCSFHPPHARCPFTSNIPWGLIVNCACGLPFPSLSLSKCIDYLRVHILNLTFNSTRHSITPLKGSCSAANEPHSKRRKRSGTSYPPSKESTYFPKNILVKLNYIFQRKLWKSAKNFDQHPASSKGGIVPLPAPHVKNSKAVMGQDLHKYIWFNTLAWFAEIVLRFKVVLKPQQLYRRQSIVWFYDQAQWRIKLTMNRWNEQSTVLYWINFNSTREQPQ